MKRMLFVLSSRRCSSPSAASVAPTRPEARTASPPAATRTGGPRAAGIDQTVVGSAERDRHDDGRRQRRRRTPTTGCRLGPGIVRARMAGSVTVPSGLFYPFNPSLQAVSTTELTVSRPGRRAQYLA